MRKDNKLAEEIKIKYHIKTRVVGDCEKVAEVSTAMHRRFFDVLSLK